LAVADSVIIETRGGTHGAGESGGEEVSAAVTAGCTVEEARRITDRIKAGLDELWALLLEAHERRAWAALGYGTWEAYVQGEFAMSRQQSYRLLDQGRVIREIRAVVEPVSPMGDTTVSEREARDLAPDLPEVVDEVRDEVDKLGPEPEPEQVADAVKDVVTRRRRSWARPEDPAGSPQDGHTAPNAASGLADPLRPEQLPQRRSGDVVLPLSIRRVKGQRPGATAPGGPGSPGGPGGTVMVFESPALPGWSVTASDPIAVARAVADAWRELEVAGYAERHGATYDLAHLAPAAAEGQPGRRWPDPWHPRLWEPLPDGRWRSPTGRVYRPQAAVVRRVVAWRRELGLPVVAPAPAMTG
jgi:hypothetical protein